MRSPRGRGSLQGGARRVRQRQDLLRPLAAGAGAQPRLRHQRGAGLRDRDAAAPPGDRLPPPDRAPRDRRHAARARCAAIVDGWFYTLEEDVLAEGTVEPGRRGRCWSPPRDQLMEQRLADVSRDRARLRGRAAGLPAARCSRTITALAEGLIAWLGGQPNVAAAVKRAAGVKGDIDHFGAAALPAGLLVDPPGLRVRRARARARRGRDAAAHARRHAREGPQRAAPADRRDRRRPLPGPVPRSPARRRSSTGRRACSACRRSPSGCTSTSRPTRASTTRGPSRSGCPASTSTGWREVGRRVRDLFAEQAQRGRADRARSSTTRYVARPRRGRHRASSAARSASRRACSSRSWSPTCSTASTSSPTSTPAGTTRLTRRRARDDRRPSGRRARRTIGRRHRARAVTAFDRLHPALQHHIVNTPRLDDRCGRPSSRPSSRSSRASTCCCWRRPPAARPRRRSSRCSPACSTEGWRGLCGALRLPAARPAQQPRAPARALRRAGRPSGGALARRRRRRRAAQASSRSARLLLTTPESLEAMLISPRVDHRAPVRRAAGGRRRRAPRVRRRRPRLASARRARAAAAARRSAACSASACRPRSATPTSCLTGWPRPAMARRVGRPRRAACRRRGRPSTSSARSTTPRR